MSQSVKTAGRQVLIFVNGQMSNWPVALDPPSGNTFVIAADGGARHCRAFDITPDLIIGDLDSLTSEELVAFKADGVEIRKFARDKDETDLELALKAALEKQAADIVILGALGRRWDMTFANVLILAAPYLQEVSVRLLDERHSVTCLSGPQRLRLTGAKGDGVSLLPLTPSVTGVTLQGLKFTLTNARLDLGSTRGISNLMLGRTAVIEIAEGCLLVSIVHK